MLKKLETTQEDTTQLIVLKYNERKKHWTPL